jgi:hypothetical protein
LKYAATCTVAWISTSLAPDARSRSTSAFSQRLGSAVSLSA